MQTGRREGKERPETRYLTDNVIIESQSTGMRRVRRGVAQFPYIWMGALSDGGQREIIIVLLRRGTVLTAVGEGGSGGVRSTWRERERGMEGCERKGKDGKNKGRGGGSMEDGWKERAMREK